jgi:hypothetical protein
MLEALCTQIRRKITDKARPDQLQDLLQQLEVHRWQLENETAAPFRAENDERMAHPITPSFMLEQWGWILAIMDPHTGRRDSHGNFSGTGEIKALCIDAFVAMIATWREIPLLDRDGQFNQLERRVDPKPSEFELLTHGDVRARVDSWLAEGGDKLRLETGRVLEAFLSCGKVPVVYRLVVHPGVAAVDILQFLAPIRELAAKLQNSAQRALDDTGHQVNEVGVVCFFDGISVESEDLFAEIIYDHQLDGERLEDNLGFVATVEENVFRGHPGFIAM